jgi:AraC-like DNA-binding protein
MFEKLNDPHRHTYDAVAALLKLFLIECNMACDIPEEQLVHTMHSGTYLFTDFKQLVEDNYQREHSVKFYAGQLAVSPDHLNKTVKSLTGRSAKEVISGRIILAAKRMLWFSNLAAKQIGYELGFEESAHFSQFFKRNSGMSPTEFRSAQNGFL